jgi:hypothetical protein
MLDIPLAMVDLSVGSISSPARRRTSNIALYHVDALESNEFGILLHVSSCLIRGFGIPVMRLITEGSGLGLRRQIDGSQPISRSPADISF